MIKLSKNNDFILSFIQKFDILNVLTIWFIELNKMFCNDLSLVHGKGSLLLLTDNTPHIKLK